MTENRKPSGRGGAKLQADSYVELPAGLSIAHGRLAHALRRGGERYDPGHLLAQIVADALTVPREELMRRALRGRAIVDALRARPEPGPGLEPSELASLGLGATDAPSGGPDPIDPVTVVTTRGEGRGEGGDQPAEQLRGKAKGHRAPAR